MTTRPRRVLTVCLGNHCRAPLAAAVLTKLGGPMIEVRSAGIRDWHVGKPAHPVMTTVASRHGYDLTGHRGVQITPDLLQWADAVLAMDNTVLEALHPIAGRDDRGKLRRYLEDQDVPDPWKQPAEAFEECLTVIEAGARHHLL